MEDSEESSVAILGPFALQIGGGALWIEESFALPDAPVIERVEPPAARGEPPALPRHFVEAAPRRKLFATLVAHRQIVIAVVSGLLVSCALYCLLAPREYEARARVVLRSAPVVAVTLDGPGQEKSGSFASGQMQLETLASVLRSDQLARQVIQTQKLYEAAAFSGSFNRRFKGYDAAHPDPAVESYLEERFSAHLHIVTLPRTLVLEVRFRSRDPVLSARVVNALIKGYEEQDAAQRKLATHLVAGWVQSQLERLRAQAERDDARLADFQKKHHLLISALSTEDGKVGEVSTCPGHGPGR